MSDLKAETNVTAELLASALPTKLTGKRVLLLSPAADEALSAELSKRKPAVLAERSPDDAWGADGPYDFIVCRDVIQADPHPAKLVLALWEALADAGALVLAAPVMTASVRSRYARFVAAAAGAGATEWLPGRLALRWSLETSGFDVERWLASAEDAPGEVGEGALLAVRTKRWPSLILATPTKPEKETDVPG
jgi:Methyltransferase domain